MVRVIGSAALIYIVEISSKHEACPTKLATRAGSLEDFAISVFLIIFRMIAANLSRGRSQKWPQIFAYTQRVIILTILVSLAMFSIIALSSSRKAFLPIPPSFEIFVSTNLARPGPWDI